MSVKDQNKSSNEGNTGKSSKIKLVKNLNNKLDSFKKKKLKNMRIEPENQGLIRDIEYLLSKKKEWTEKDIEKLLLKMYNPSEVATIYGFQIEKGILEFIDSASSFKCIQLSALIMSRFANIKKSNGALLLQRVLKTLLNIGKEYFDFFDISSNLIEITFDFTVPIINFPVLIITNETLPILIKRINFLIYVIYFIFEVKTDLSLPNMFEDLVKIFITFLSITPGELLGNKLRQSPVIMSIPDTVNSNIWKVIDCIFSFLGFNNYEHVPKFCRIIKLCLSDELIENNITYHLYISNILGFLSNILDNGGIYCLSSISPLIQLMVQKRIDAIVSLACTNSQERILTLYLKVLNKYMAHYRDRNVEKCLVNLKQSLIHIRNNLIYLHSKSIYSNNDFKIEYNLFMKSFILCIPDNCTDSVILFDYLRTENSNCQFRSPSSDEVVLMETTNDELNGTETEEIKLDHSVMKIENNEDQYFEELQNNIDIQLDEEYEIKKSNTDNETNELCEITNVMEADYEKPELQYDSNHLLFVDSKAIDLEEMLKSFVPI